ncbi:GIP, partial [Symbiodinium sp. CCMP2456]
MSSPGGSPTAGGPGSAEMLLGQILQQMQAGMIQMSADANRRFELLEAAMREQAVACRACVEAQTKTLESLAKKSSVVDIKGVGKPEMLKGPHEDARKVWKTWSYKFESCFSSQSPAKGAGKTEQPKGGGNPDKANGGTGQPPAASQRDQRRKTAEGKRRKRRQNRPRRGRGPGWPGEEWPEEETGDGELGLLRVLGPSVDSTLSLPAPAKGQICRPAFGPSSWAWSQPWEVALAQCAVGKENTGETIYWCPASEEESGDSEESSGDEEEEEDARRTSGQRKTLKGNFARVEPEGDLRSHRYGQGKPTVATKGKEVSTHFSVGGETKDEAERYLNLRHPTPGEGRQRAGAESSREVRPATQEAEAGVSEGGTAKEPEPKASGKYVPPHLRAKQGGLASSSTQAPAYSVSKASRSVLLGEMLSARVARREDLNKALDDLPEGDPAREVTAAEIKELDIVIRNVKEEQRATRKGEKAGHSSRQERDKEQMGGRLAYLKDRSRKRAAEHRLKTQRERTKSNLSRQLTWARRFDQPGAGRKTQVFPLTEKELKHEMAAAPLSRHARTALLEEVTPAKKKAKHKKERRREKRKKARVGNLAAFSNSSEGRTKPGAGTDGWTRIDFVVDSGASATTLPRKVLGETTVLKAPVGYHSFRLADGSLVENEGTLEAKAWLLGDEVLELKASVAAISQALLSVGQVTSRGNRVVLGPKVSYLETKAGKKHRIFLKNGVYVLPVWMDTSSKLLSLSRGKSFAHRRVNRPGDPEEESSIKALAEAVKNSFAAREGVRVQLENSPEGDDHGKSNGEAEAAVEITQGLCRTYKDACEKGLGERIHPKSPLLGWLVEHAGCMYTLFAHDETLKDGLTPFRHLKGRDWAVALPAWGETVDYRVCTKHKLEARWQVGIYCGVRLGTTEKIVATEDGVVVVQSIRRKPKELRWDAELFKKVKGTPWAPSPKKAARPHEALELPAAVAIEPEMPDEVATDVEAGPKPELLKRVYLRTQDLERHGYTASCPACDLIRAGITREGVNHSEFCRNRVVTEMAKTEEEGKKRLAAAKLKETPKSRLRVGESAEGSDPQASVPVVKRTTTGGPSIEEAQASKKVKAEEAKRARLDPGGSSAGSAQAPVREASREVSEPPASERSAPSKRPHEGGGGDEDMVLDLILSLRSGYLASVAGDPYPVCEERFDTDVYEKFETSYWDDVSGKPLRPELVQEARKEEVSTIKEMGVWEVIPRPKGEKVISTRWVDINKKDEANPKYRSRLVARELKKRYPGGVSQDVHQPSWEDFYASMPPISALRVLFALATSKRAPDLEGKMRDLPKDQCLVFLDIKKAHFWADARRRLLIELPAETGVDTSKYVGLLRKSLYGTRDAPANWEATILRVMTQLGFVRGRSNSCLYYHPIREIRVEVHGKHWTVEVRGYLGPPGMVGTKQSIDILNRLVSWISRGIELEADPRHVDIILREIGCEGAKVTTALVKERIEEVENAEPLSSEDASWYRSVSMRLAYLSQDRPDLQVLAKELAKGLKSPTTAHLMMLKRGARYLRNSPRLLQLFPYQSCVKRLTNWVDWGILLPIQAFMDASTGLSIGSRHGLGRVKHIDTVFLWVQDVVASGRILLGKKHTDEMLADLLTKPLDRARIQLLLQGLNCVYAEGRHHLALN